MAYTNIATGDNSAKKLYEEIRFATSYKKSFWLSKQSPKEGLNNVLYTNNKMDGKSGDRVSIDFITRFAAAARGEGDALEGHEGSLTPYTFNLTLAEKHVLLRYKGKLSAQRPAWSLSAAHEQALEGRGAEVIDEQIFDALQATDPNKVFYAGSATSTATLTASDLLTPERLVRTRTWMETGGDYAQNAVEPIMEKGEPYYMGLFYNDSFYDLWQDPTIQQATREAHNRGGENPLFRDAPMIWNNITVFKHPNVEKFTNGGSGSDVNYAKGFLMGRGAMAIAWGQRPEIETETFEYKSQVGHDFNYILAAGRPEFNSLDYAVVGLYAARTQISDV